MISTSDLPAASDRPENPQPRVLSPEEEQNQERAHDEARSAEYRTARGDRAGPVDLAEPFGEIPGVSDPGEDLTAGDAVSSDPDGLDATNVDPADRGARIVLGEVGRQRQSQDLYGAVTTDGMGYVVRKLSSPDHLLERCRICGGEIPLPPDVCEFADSPPYGPEARRRQVAGMHVAYVEYGATTSRLGAASPPIISERVPARFVRPLNRPARPGFKCRCNGCVTKLRSPGNQPETCGSAECQREMKRRRDTRERERRRNQDRSVAAEWIEAYPDATDQELMTWSGISTRKRFTEARAA